MRYSGFLTGCSNSWPEPKTFYHVQSRCRTSLSEMYLTTTPEPKEEPRVRVWEDCPSCFMCVKLHSLVSINVCTNSERKQLFCFIFFFYFFFCSSDQRTNRQTCGQTMDGWSGDGRCISPLPAVRRRPSTDDRQLRARHGQTADGGGPDRPEPPPLPVHVPVMSWRRGLSYQWMNTYLSACFGYTAMGNITWLLLNDLYSCSFIKDLLYRCII